MNNVTFKIETFPGTEKMLAVGILGRANVTVQDSEEVAIVTIYDVLIRQNDKGPWVAWPSRTAGDMKDENGKPKYFPVVKMYPNDPETWYKLNDRILAELNKGNKTPIKASGAPQSASRPSSNARTPAATAKPVSVAPRGRQPGINYDDDSPM